MKIIDVKKRKKIEKPRLLVYALNLLNLVQSCNDFSTLLRRLRVLVFLTLLDEEPWLNYVFTS